MGLGIFGIGFIVILVILAVRLLRAPLTAATPALSSSIGAFTVASIHSMFDFPLQVQADAFIFVMLVAIGHAQARRSPETGALNHATQVVTSPVVKKSRKEISIRSFLMLMFCASLLGAAKEAAPFAQSRASFAYRLIWAQRQSFPMALSFGWQTETARRRNIQNCLSTLSEAEIRPDIPDVTLKGIGSGCYATVENAIAEAPMSANEWLVGAGLSHKLNGGKSVSYLEMSYRFGPNEQWIAERRVSLAIALQGKLTAYVHRGFDNDIRLLLRSVRGRQLMARRCTTDRTFCAHVIEIAGFMAEVRDEFFALLN